QNLIMGNQENISGDKNVVGGSAGLVGGRGHQIHDIAWNQIQSTTDLPALAGELAKLRQALLSSAKSAPESAAVGAVAQAEIAAEKGDGPSALRFLKQAGTWALETAKEIALKTAATAIRAALRLPPQ